MRRWIVSLATAIFAASAAVTPAAANGFAGWAAMVVAGDDRAHSGRPSQAFDDARRDLAAALEGIGFLRNHVLQFSAQPERYQDKPPLRSGVKSIYAALHQLTGEASGGCFLYFTSHGATDGVLVGEDVLSPRALAQMLDETCGDRLTVVVVSACYSGVFVPVLQTANRMILTAARKDRSSFGCGESDKYTFFDECVLSSLNSAHDFLALGTGAQACVAAREKKEGAKPPSEPQLSIGSTIERMLPLFPFHQN